MDFWKLGIWVIATCVRSRGTQKVIFLFFSLSLPICNGCDVGNWNTLAAIIRPTGVSRPPLEAFLKDLYTELGIKNVAPDNLVRLGQDCLGYLNFLRFLNAKKGDVPCVHLFSCFTDKTYQLHFCEMHLLEQFSSWLTNFIDSLSGGMPITFKSLLLSSVAVRMSADDLSMSAKWVSAKKTL